MKGFSLIELMVGLALSLVIMFALVTLFGNNSRARDQIDQASQQIENGRFALELIRDDLHLAGYYGSVVPQSGYKVANAAVPTDVELCGTALADIHFTLSPLQWPVPVFGISAGDGVPTCVSSATGGHKSGTDILVVRRSRTVPAGTLVNGEIYLQASGCNAELMQHKDFVANVGSSGLFVLKKKGCGATGDIYRFETRIYYISNETVPTLRMLTISGSTSTNEPLVQGIQDLRLEFGRDSNNDGLADEYRKCLATAVLPAVADACNTAEWANMMAVRVHLLARNIGTLPGYVDTKTYALGSTTTVGPFNDGYKRHAYSSVVRLMNPAGSREL
jgi:type IV pilus assembly protein PilW